MNTRRVPASCASMRGLSIVEFMVAIGIGLLVLVGVLGVMVSSAKSNTEEMRTIRLNQELRAIMDVISRDIRRAGFTTRYPCDVGKFDVGSQYSNSITIENGGSSISYVYELPTDPPRPVPTGPDDPLCLTARPSLPTYGFKLENETVKTVAGVEVSDPRATRILQLKFCFWPSGDDVCLTAVPDAAKTGTSATDQTIISNVQITLTGALVSDVASARTLREIVRVRNDAFINR